MEQKPLPIGIDNFEMLITRGYYFVDKTLLIKDILDNKAAVNLFTRPRRFGKTLNVSSNLTPRAKPFTIRQDLEGPENFQWQAYAWHFFLK